MQPFAARVMVQTMRGGDAMSVEQIGQIDGRAVQAVTLGGGAGPRARVITYGARLAELWVPGRAGVLADIVLGHDEATGYRTAKGYLGATCGRYSNRIAGARFMLNGREVLLDANEGEKHLHGGREGFDRKIWNIAEVSARAVTLTATAEDGEMGYPGRLSMQVRYWLDPSDRLWIAMEASTDAATVVNMVNHSYFNMAGSGSVMGQQLRLGSTHYTPVGADLIPTGEVLAVAGTPFDFMALREIGAAVPSDAGFDHNLCLTGPLVPKWGETLRFCAEAVDAASGRRMEVWTTEPGVQLYTGAFLGGGGPGKGGVPIAPFTGFTLETQTFPDSPNRPQFPSARLEPGQRYRHLMAFDFTPLPG
ncbi:MAG: aldose epimerase family protein [Pseudotabrizicola sp.]|uniref:aldose epimerase family protein n=1 Tax=Pseudotabrizicola sp. TaxID=2939647 RepID=UPI0027315AAF|nr:aldose epimerase family protein [Pseudotabrizicola sp.]MDP2080484.1 aldose epimerase family protein [Pseudotabrizicola sp.]MDZ7573671.1 aldose epimerase family protein [Pseudotabrizicola sp.]